MMDEAVEDKVSTNTSTCCSGRRWFVGTDAYQSGVESYPLHMVGGALSVSSRMEVIALWLWVGPISIISQGNGALRFVCN